MKDKMILASNIAERIIFIRGQKVILDEDLAALYAVPTKRFNEQIKRNKRRFPHDFMFRLRKQEVAILRSQFATSSWGGRRHLPLAFTEHGAIMAATILNSEKAIEISVHVVRVFVKLRTILTQHKDLAHKLVELESRIGTHDKAIRSLFDAIRQLMTPPEKEKRPVGFVPTG
jgi:hypothetical protein